MKNELLDIINFIRVSKGQNTLTSINLDDKLRDDIEFTSFDLAELTVRIEDKFDIDIFEDGLVTTIKEILEKLENTK